MIAIRDERDCLFIRFLADKNKCQWWLFTYKGVLQSQGEGALEDLLGEYKENGSRLNLILPAKLTGLLSVDCPSKLQNKLDLALPFLIEERLIANIETQQAAVLDRANTLVAGVIDRDVLDAYLQPLKAMGWESESVVPESWLWLKRRPFPAVHLEDQHAWFALDSQKLGCMPVTLFADWLAIEEDSLLPALTAISSNNEDTRTDFLKRIPEVMAEQLQWQEDVDWEQLLASETSEISNGLLCGDYAPKADWRASLQCWKGFIATIVLLLAGHSAVLGFQQWQLNRALQEADQELLGWFHQVMPGSRAINPRVQLNQALAQLQGAPSHQFMPVFYGLARRIQALPGATLTDVQYDGQDGRLQAGILLPDVLALESLLEDGGSDVRITLDSSVRQAGRLRASLTVVLHD